MRPGVFLDRDGVLNEAVVVDGRPRPPAPGQLRIVDRAPEACALLREAGYVLVVVTNQPDVARGAVSLAEVEAQNHQLAEALGIDHVRMCVHDDGDGCTCRKPLPGMILDAAADYRLDLRASWLIGDRWRDIRAGQAAGVTTVLVDHQYAEMRVEGDVVVRSFEEAVTAILAEGTPKWTSSEN